MRGGNECQCLDANANVLTKHLIIKDHFSSVEYDEQLEDQLKPSSPMNSWSIHPQVECPKMNAVLNDGKELK